MISISPDLDAHVVIPWTVQLWLYTFVIWLIGLSGVTVHSRVLPKPGAAAAGCCRARGPRLRAATGGIDGLVKLRVGIS